MTAASRWTVLLLLSATTSCRVPARPAPVSVTTWGTFHEVLASGHTEGRVALTGLATPGAIGVGALAELAGEMTIVDGRVLVAKPDGQECEVTGAGPGDRAALLVLAEVERWQEHELVDCSSYAELDAAIARELERWGFDLNEPTPVRVRARAPHVELHVLAGACPIAHPEGPPPWRFAGAAEHVEIVGVFVEGGTGRLTHHSQRSHLHVVADGKMGHLDEVALQDAVLLLPARAR